MINSLYLKHFVKHKEVHVEFTEGVNHICGENEAGKSLLIEAIGFALFGSSALRLPANTYSKATSVSLYFQVAGQEYTLYRTLSLAELQTNGSIIASGNKPVTETINRLFGFNQQVFNVANLCKQFDVTRMSSLTPADRRRIIDNVVGLSGIETVIKQHKAQLTTLSGSLRSLESVRPAKVFEPDKSVDQQLIESYSSVMQGRNRALIELQGNRDQYLRLSQKLANCRIIAAKPLPFDFDPREAEYHRANVSRLAAQIKNPHAQPPTITLGQLEQDWHDYTMQKQKRELEAMGGHSCESCGHFTALGGVKLKELKSQLGDAVVAQPSLSIQQWKQQNQSYLELVKNREALSELIKNCGKPFTSEQIGEQVEAIASHSAHAQSVEARERLATELAELNYDSKETEETIAKLMAEQNSLTSQYQHQIDLKHQWVAFEKSQSSLEGWTARHRELETEAEELKLEVLVLTELMAKIKSELLPNVNQVASSLLSLMSDGTHTELELTDEMDILVGGTSVDALSGSGKSIAHLALRLSLAQILTTGVFPVFIADEVDASMTENRSSLTLQALRLMLKKTVKQLIIISHKTLDDVDHVIQL